MKPVLTHIATAAISLLALAGCNDPSRAIAEAKPAGGVQLQEFSRESTHAIKLSRDAALLSRYCHNMSGAPCALDTVARLGKYGFNDGGTGIDLAYAFIGMAADDKDGAADQKSSDEDFVAAAYRVALGREADPEGAANHLATIKDQGVDVRKALVLDFIKSTEFKSQM